VKRVLAYLGVTVALTATGLFVTAQLNLKTFTAGEVIRADEVNQNFQTLAAAIGSSQLPSECQAGEVAKWDGTAWTCAQDAVGEGGGDITGVLAGEGLTGGGTSGDVTLELDTATTDERYYRKVEVDTAITAAVEAIPAAEAIVTAGSNMPQTLTVQLSSRTTEETFTTTRAGRLLISKVFGGELNCAESAGRYYFLTVDGEPVRSSLVIRPSSDPAYWGPLIGMTEASVPAGEHTLAAGAQCNFGATAPNSSFSAISMSTILVLPE
jgi:hypothetical protein